MGIKVKKDMALHVSVSSHLFLIRSKIKNEKKENMADASWQEAQTFCLWQHQ